jgi:hypothetical protein
MPQNRVHGLYLQCGTNAARGATICFLHLQRIDLAGKSAPSVGENLVAHAPSLPLPCLRRAARAGVLGWAGAPPLVLSPSRHTGALFPAPIGPVRNPWFPTVCWDYGRAVWHGVTPLCHTCVSGATRGFYMTPSVSPSRRPERFLTNAKSSGKRACRIARRSHKCHHSLRELR